MGKRERKVYVGFMLDQNFKIAIEKIVENPNSTFDSEAGLIRFCIKKAVPKILEELEQKK